MPLNPLRDALSRAGLNAHRHDSPFAAEADAALARFEETRAELERQVRRGDLTVKVARDRAAEAAAALKSDLIPRAQSFSPTPRAFLDRLIEADDARRRSRDGASAEALQRETNRLLRLNLIEQQMQTRSAEFEGRAFRRAIGGVPAPTLDGLLEFHQGATLAGDDTAREWGRRQLESLRTRVLDEKDADAIDLACDRPEQVNPRVVTRYVEAMRDREPEAMESFVAEALSARDAGACSAAFLLAREVPEGPRLRWVRQVLGGLGEFPDSALSTLRALEVEARAAEAEAARSKAEYAVARAEAEVRLPGLEPPSPAELERMSIASSKPVVSWGEAIGLGADRRWPSADDAPNEFDPTDMD